MTNIKLRHAAMALSLTGAFAFSSSAALANAGHHMDFKEMDTNGDGKVSPEEHEATAKKMFETMDANRDGTVTAAEMDAAHEQIAGKKGRKTEMSAADKIKVVDTNGDGQLTAAEHETASKKMFEMMDTNKDGFLTKSEIEAGHAKMMTKKAAK